MKKVGRVPVELVGDPNDKHPFRKKQQKTISDGSCKEKDIKKKLKLADKWAKNLQKGLIEK